MRNCNKKYYQTLFLIVFALLTAYSLQLSATIRYVSKTGNSTPPYTSWATAADSIQKCINVCVFGDTIYVANGVYEEQVVMISGLSLIGAGMDSCVIYLSATGIPAVQIADTCFLEGFKILLPNTMNTWGIEVIGFDSFITLNNVVNASLGLYLSDVYAEVYKNTFQNIKTRGIWILNSNSIIRQNHIYIDPNSQASSPTGIRIEAFSDTYTSLIDSNYLVNVYYTGIDKFLGTTPTIKNNVIIMKYGTGIDIDDGGTTTIANNIILNSGYIGINGFSPSYILLYNNYIMGKPGSDGIKVWSNSVVRIM